MEFVWTAIKFLPFRRSPNISNAHENPNVLDRKRRLSMLLLLDHAGHLETVRRQVQGPEPSGDEAILQRRQPHRRATLHRRALVGPSAEWGGSLKDRRLADRPRMRSVMPQLIHTGQEQNARKILLHDPAKPSCEAARLSNLKIRVFTLKCHVFVFVLFVAIFFLVLFFKKNAIVFFSCAH